MIRNYFYFSFFIMFAYYRNVAKQLLYIIYIVYSAAAKCFGQNTQWKTMASVPFTLSYRYKGFDHRLDECILP